MKVKHSRNKGRHSGKKAKHGRNRGKYTEKKGLIFVISGPSGSGKTTLRDRLLQDRKLKEALKKSISLTTRPKRSKEKNKQDYFFITEEEFRHRLKEKKILEWTKYLGYYYATPKDFLEKRVKQKKYSVLCLDLKGASKIKELFPNNAITIFVMPPSLEILKHRIEGRCSKTRKEEIKKRIKLAQAEILAAYKYDYCVLNCSLSQAVKKTKNIILKEIK